MTHVSAPRQPWDSYTWRLVKSSQGLGGKMAAGSFIAKAISHKLVGVPGHATLDFRGSRMHIALGRGELGPILDIQADREYEIDADFVPTVGWLVIDVGANIGAFAVLQGIRGATVLAFEPDDQSYQRLLRSIAATRMRGTVTARRAALGEATGVGNLHRSNQTTRTKVLRGEPTVGGESVAVITLDKVIQELARCRVDLLKIDAEGSELAILMGANEKLRCVRRIALEYHSKELRAGVIEHLREQGFELVGERPYTDAVGLVFFSSPSL